MTTAVSADLERHVSCLIVAIEFYPQMAIKMIKAEVNRVLKRIENKSSNYCEKYLKSSKEDLISKLSTSGFNELDITLLYRLMRQLRLVSIPTQKWGNQPLARNMKQGDDLERMRINRNHIIHRRTVTVSEEKRNTFFKESIEIACRIDKFMRDSTGSLEAKIRNAKMYSVTQEQSRQALEKCPNLQGKFNIPQITEIMLTL